jgi:hypothetical protein
MMIFLEPKLIGGANLVGNMVSEKRVSRISPDSDESMGFRRIRGILANFSYFAGFWRDFARITVHGYSELLLRTCWGKKITVEGILGKNAYIERN